jgi:tRNA threonylcarbamoyladenosine modification (KEOPS) complex  Pcc1 subunit
MLEATATVTIEFETEEQAERAYGAVHPDDDDFVETRREGPLLSGKFRAKDSRSLLRAVDDFLACLGVSEDVMNAPPMDD